MEEKTILIEAINWYNGEIFEAVVFGSFGLLLLIVSGILGEYGTTENARHLVLPILAVGAILFATGIGGAVSNKSKIDELKSLEKINETEFLTDEIERVENFQYLYTVTHYLFIFCAVSALIFFMFMNVNWLKAVGIALVLLGLSGLIIDYFSKERADNYYRFLKSKTGNSLTQIQ